MFQSSTRPRFFVSRWIRRWIKRLLEEDTAIRPIVQWQRVMKMCISCHASLQKETPFCPYCGYGPSGRPQNTEPIAPVRHSTLAERLQAAYVPGERWLHTYKRVIGGTRNHDHE